MSESSKTNNEFVIVNNRICSPAERWFDWLEQMNLEKWSAIITLLFGLYVRWTVGLNPYSGQNIPPMYGDYEAQRHWMELTLHIPINQWYSNSSSNNLEWWGLDYPPLTAYVSWICGKIGSIFNPEWFALDVSRGFESEESKLFMRSSVLVLEYLIYVPSIFVFANWWFSNESWKKRGLAVLFIFLQPALILIDHGHFQYNSVMLGLTIWSLNCFFYDYDVLGSIFFCLALGFKQMALYFAPAIFAYLLGKCIKKTPQGAILFVKLGVTVIVMFVVIFFPFLDSIERISQVIIRIFPLNRGLYEDKVANIWCAVNIIIKLREIFEIHTLARISLFTTLLAILPSCIHLGLNPDKHQLLYCLANSALAFFMFSFQVHEKSILLPALPITLLILDEPFWSSWFNNVAVFSMFPLLKKDRLILPYFVVWLMWNWMGSFVQQDVKPIILKYISWMSYVVMAVIHFLDFTIAPPKRYPDLYVVLNVIFSAGIYLFMLLYFNYRQIRLSRELSKIKAE